MSSKKKMLRNHIRRDKLWNQDLTVIAYLRKRGAEIDVKNKTVKVDMEALNKKEQEKLKELERWGYKVNEQQTYFSTHSPLWNYEILETEDNSFIAFADEIMAMYY